MTVQTEVNLQNIRPVPDLGAHMLVAQTGIEKLRFPVMCAVHTVMREIICVTYEQIRSDWLTLGL